MKILTVYKIIYKIFSLFLVTCVCTSNAATFKNGETIFNINLLHEIRLTFSQPHYWDTLTARYSASHDSIPVDNNEMVANVQIDGIKLDSIGVKLKSNYSYTAPSNKKPIKLHFNAFIKEKNFQGLHRLNLSNEFPDPSMLRNTVAFNILRKAGVLAPRTSFAKVYVNNIFMGLYVIIEQVDREFLSNQFRNPGGDLIKSNASYLYWFKDDDTLSFSKNFEVKTNNSRAATSSLFSFAKKINTTPADVFYDSLKTIFDFDSYIPVLAADIIFNNWDSYFYGQNYYLYRDSVENKYYYLPWDYNISLNNYAVSGGDYDILPGGKNDNIFELPLPNKIINNKNLRKEYIDRLYRINQYFSEDSLKTFIYKLHDLIRPALQIDEGKIFTMDQYEKSLSQRVSISEIEFEGLLSFINYRHEQVAKMIDEAKIER